MKVVLLRGVNVGGHKTFRPSILAAQLKHLDVVNIGAAGTFVVRKRVSRAQLTAEFSRRLPFEITIVICDGRDIARLISRDVLATHPVGPGIVPFVSVMSRSPRSMPATPVQFPPKGRWLVKVVATDQQFVVGIYRREMKAIGCLGSLDKAFGSPVTTRNWNTIIAIATVLGHQPR